MTDPLRLGIDLGGTKIEAALLDARGHTVWAQRIPTPANRYDDIVAAVVDLTRRARQEAGTDITIGIGTPGSLTPEGLLKNANTTCLNGRRLHTDFEAALGQPVRMANDANCLALSEATDGAGAGAGVVFAAILGTGVGAGIVMHGQLHRGPNGLAGEWGHNPLPWATAEESASTCFCGRRGCVETWLSGPALAADHARMCGQASTAQTIASGAASGDPACHETLNRHVDRTARALAAVINLLDPDVIVLGGGLSGMAHLYEQVPALWARWVFAGGQVDAVRTALRPARHGDASGVRGAAWLWPPASAPGSSTSA